MRNQNAESESESESRIELLMLVVLVQVTVKSEMLAEFERAILINAESARTREPGCVRFDVSQREDDPTQWLFYEVYKDGAAFEAHRASPHFAAYQQVAERVLLSKTLTRYSTKN
jgi:(4S)-4-hydroxy-5-phosphonooxypentane-2,3-dione isomerase